MIRNVWKTRATPGLVAAATVVAVWALACGSPIRGPGGAVTAPVANGNAPKRMSDSGLARIRAREAFVPRPYNDGAGNMTIGYGHLIRKGESYSGGITQAQADTLFRQDVERVVNPALDRITINLTQNQIDALGSFIFNVGTGGFIKSILPHLNAGEKQGVTSRMLQFVTGRDANTGRHQLLRGLLTRRQFEVALFNNPTPLSFLQRLVRRP